MTCESCGYPGHLDIARRTSHTAAIFACHRCGAEQGGVIRLDPAWIAVDLDGTLAHYDGWRGPDHIGPPVAAMKERVDRWHLEGRDVRIFTARVAANNPDSDRARDAIADWQVDHFGFAFPVTNAKDMAMAALWDDLAVQVITNTGVRADGR